MAKDDNVNESLNDAAVISAFKDKTKEMFHELDGMNPETIEANVKNIVQGIVNDYGMDITIEDVVVSGSRCRGMEDKGADLDVVSLKILYKSKMEVIIKTLAKEMCRYMERAG